MPDVGDRVVLPSLGGHRLHGVVTTISGSVLTVRTDVGTLVVGAELVTVIRLVRAA